jgi:hypothetical protein
MSTSSTPRPASPARPGHPTRQLLDELDALMQRMLALPVEQLDDEPQAKPDDVATTPTAADLAAEPLPTEEDEAKVDDVAEEEPLSRENAPAENCASPAALAEAPSEVPCPLPSEPDLDRIIPASPEVLEALGRRPPPEPERKRDARPLQPLPFALPSLPHVLSDSRMTAAPGWLRPILWSNRVFDRCTAWFGPPGRWLRGPRGRAFVGWLGLGILVGGLVWLLVNEIGWTW